MGSFKSGIGGSKTSIFSGYIGGTRNDNISSGFAGIDGVIGPGALIRAIGGIESGNLCRRIGGGIIGVGVEVRASLSSSIYGQFNYGITGGSIDVILVSLSSGNL